MKRTALRTASCGSIVFAAVVLIGLSTTSVTRAQTPSDSCKRHDADDTHHHGASEQRPALCGHDHRAVHPRQHPARLRLLFLADLRRAQRAGGRRRDRLRQGSGRRCGARLAIVEGHRLDHAAGRRQADAVGHAADDTENLPGPGPVGNRDRHDGRKNPQRAQRHEPAVQDRAADRPERTICPLRHHRERADVRLHRQQHALQRRGPERVHHPRWTSRRAS